MLCMVPWRRLWSKSGWASISTTVKIKVFACEELEAVPMDLAFVSDLRRGDVSDVKVLPVQELSQMLALAHHFSWTGQSDEFDKLKTAFECEYAAEYESNARMAHFSAQLTWVNGNVLRAGAEFSRLYDDYPHLRGVILKMVRSLIMKTCDGQGLAAVSTVTDFAQDLSSRSGDLSVLGTLWCALFLSSWHVDQTKSVELLKSQDNLRTYVHFIIPKLSIFLLRENRTEDFHRLIEITLLLEMTSTTGQLLRFLFDYYYKKGYVKGCTAVINCADELNIELTRDQLFKYQNLIKSNRIAPSLLTPITVPNVRYKF